MRWTPPTRYGRAMANIWCSWRAIRQRRFRSSRLSICRSAMKYLPLVWAGLRRRPAHPILTAIAMAFAACLAGLTVGMARLLPPSGDLDLAVRAIAGIGFLLILFLTIHAVAQALRERGWEFALLRVLGFSRRLVLGLFFLEAASACLTGVMIGIALAQFLFFLVCHLIFPPMTA